MKEIKFIYGQENGLVVENQQKDDSIFFEQYQQAHHLILNIEQSMSNDSPNMLAFCGDRGDGKTSCMQSVLEQIKDGESGSSRAREFHPHPLTEPCVKVSPHTALHTQLFVHRHNLGV